MRRDLDLHIAELARRTDDLNAELQRNMSQEQRQHELEVEQQRYEKQMAIEHERYEQERIKYLAQLSLSYMNEISNLLEKTDGYLNSNPLTAALARAKTLNVIGQLGSNRSRQLIEFLHDAKQMTTDDKPLDLSGAQLNKLDFRGSSALHTRKKLSLVGISLNEATFEGLQIDGWDFTAASLNGANFRYCNISNTIFHTRSDRLILANFDERLRELEDIRCEYEQSRALSRDIYATETYKIASEEHSITIKLFLSIFIRRKSIL
ncbi:unnamed protein product [Rotaria sordida]|uniref:Pentapeptide repeat-containing protein n=1 Tax=Rotaria sordida TaxID=392033 RepID=A0A815FRY4_9BILA|nr:unnamed protein product [Rotaria sordida]